jgi:hypothetical protein
MHNQQRLQMAGKLTHRQWQPQQLLCQLLQPGAVQCCWAAGVPQEVQRGDGVHEPGIGPGDIAITRRRRRCCASLAHACSCGFRRRQGQPRLQPPAQRSDDAAAQHMLLRRCPQHLAASDQQAVQAVQGCEGWVALEVRAREPAWLTGADLGADQR